MVAVAARDARGQQFSYTENRIISNGRHPMDHPRISTDPAVMVGKPCIKGTRITVELILRWLAAGRSFAELLEAYPHVTEPDLRAALAFAADTVNSTRPVAAE